MLKDFSATCYFREKIVTLDKEEQPERLYDLQHIRCALVTWMKHTIRDVQQNKTKISATKLLSNNTALWIKDWAQKIIPMKFRKSQPDYFGKKGMSLHVDVLLFSTERDILEKQVYFTIIEQSNQLNIGPGKDVYRRFVFPITAHRCF